MNNINPDPLGTPIYLYEEGEPMPNDKFFYLLSAEGLMVGRNHPFFQSLAPATSGPKELASREAFIKPRFPLIPQRLMERAVGFFSAIHEEHNWESAVLFVWNKHTQQVEMIVPEQQANSSDVKYTVPILASHLQYLGDMHCHGSWDCKPSLTDENDEANRPGIHLIVGKICREPPEFGCVLVADGFRYEAKARDMIEGYQERDEEVPTEWLSQVKHKVFTSEYGYGTYDSSEYRKKDKESVQAVLAGFQAKPGIPTLAEVRGELFQKTRSMSYLECEAKASTFLEKLKKARKYETPV